MAKFKVNNHNIQNEYAFTLIELIIVIIIISIMAVTVLPKFFSSNGFEEYTYRDELITKLRAIQLRSMQQTNNSTCKQIKVETSPYSIGLQATGSVTNLCTADYAGDSTKITVDSKHNVSFTLSESLTSFSFSALGKPLGCTPVNLCGITITVDGENSAPQLLINSEGYIHAI